MKIVSHNQQHILTLLFQLCVWPEQPFSIRLNLWITLSAELDQLLGIWPEKDLDTTQARKCSTLCLSSPVFLLLFVIRIVCWTRFSHKRPIINRKLWLESTVSRWHTLFLIYILVFCLFFFFFFSLKNAQKRAISFSSNWVSAADKESKLPLADNL